MDNIFRELKELRNTNFLGWQKNYFPKPQDLVSDNEVPHYIKCKDAFKYSRGIRRAAKIYYCCSQYLTQGFPG